MYMISISRWLLNSDSNICRLIYVTASDGPGGISDGPFQNGLEYFWSRGAKCKKIKCMKLKYLNWCKQNCACCQDRIIVSGKPIYIPPIVKDVDDAQRCRRWRKRRNESKCECKFGKLSIV